MSSIKKNYIYNTAFSILNMFIPLVTAPYLARILGTEGVGTYAYYFTVAQYFTIFAKMGLTNYGTRYIAAIRDDLEKLKSGFSSLYVMQICVTLSAFIIYMLYVGFLAEEKVLAVIFGIWLIFVAFDTDWLLFALEEFKSAAVRNCAVKIASTIAVIVIVKDVGDVWKYALITAISYIAGYLFLWVKCRTYLSFQYVTPQKVFEHIKPCFLLLIPILALNIYRTMDKVMLGILSDMHETGLYEYAEKIVYCLTAFISSFGAVMLPRISNLLAQNEKKAVAKYISNSMSFLIFLSSGMCFGISAVADSLIPILYGQNFSGSIVLLKLLAVTLMFIAWGNVIRTQYVIPSKRDNIYIGSILTGAVVNLVANAALIPQFSAVGACIGTILAEFSVLVFQAVRLHRELPYLRYLKNVLPFVSFGIIMQLMCGLIEQIRGTGFGTLLIQLVCGFVLYSGLSLLYFEKFLGIHVLHKIREKR